MANFDIVVTTPSRLHFGLLNLSAHGQRVDGGAGLMIHQPSLTIKVRPFNGLMVEPSHMTDEVIFCIEKLRIKDPGVAFQICDALPAHVGLGWRTQLRLGIATATCLAMRTPFKSTELAPLMERGGTSGIGSWGFWYGGIIIDGGHLRGKKQMFSPSSVARQPTLPPLLFHEEFPWWIVAGIAANMDRISGDQEMELFSRYAPVPWSETLEITRVVFTELAPAVKERHFSNFCESISQLSQLGFKRREIEFREAEGSEALRRMERAGACGVSMSSWGPTYFGFLPSESEAEHVAKVLQRDHFFSNAWSAKASTGAVINVNGQLLTASDLVSS